MQLAHGAVTDIKCPDRRLDVYLSNGFLVNYLAINHI